MTPRRLAPRAVAFASALAALSCGSTGSAPPAPPAEAAQRGGTIVLGSITDVDAWNEYTSAQTFAVNLLRRIDLRLAQEQGDAKDHPPTFAPLLASSWSFSPDGLTLTFVLRDATWSDGQPITASDVRFTWTAQRAPEVAWPGASFKEHIAEVTAVDPKTVAFRFDRSYPEMLADAVEGGILPEHVFGKVPFAEWRAHDWSTAKIGSGPFVLESWRPGEEIVLARNPRYYAAPLPYADKVAVRVVPDVGNLETQLLSGAIDYLEGIPPADAARVGAGKGVTVVAFDNPMFDYVGWNGAKPPFDDRDVRRALTLGIDRNAIVEDLLFGRGRVSTGPLLSGWWAADPTVEAWPYDPKEAARLLAAKGYGPKRPLRIELLSNAGNRLRESVALKIQEQLKQVGVEVTPRTVEMKALREASAAGRYDAYIGGWRFSGKLDLANIFGSASTPPRGSNVVAYRSPEVDTLLASLSAAPDWTAAKPIYAAIARKIRDDQPYTFLYEAKRLAVAGPRLRAVAIDVPQDPLARLERFWIAR